MGQIRDDLFSHTVAEVLLVWVRADVFEGQDNDGFFSFRHT